MQHGFTRNSATVTIWAQEPDPKNIMRSWHDSFFRGPGSWGRTPGRAARAFARHLSGLQAPGEGGAMVVPMPRWGMVRLPLRGR